MVGSGAEEESNKQEDEPGIKPPLFKCLLFNIIFVASSVQLLSDCSGLMFVV